MTRLSDTQLVILSAAAQRADLSVLPLPDSLTLKGGALNKVMDSLRNRGLIRVTRRRRRTRTGGHHQRGHGRDRRRGGRRRGAGGRRHSPDVGRGRQCGRRPGARQRGRRRGDAGEAQAGQGQGQGKATKTAPATSEPEAPASRPEAHAARRHQAGPDDRAAQAPRGRHGRADRRGHRLAAPHHPRRHLRRAQEEARAHGRGHPHPRGRPQQDRRQGQQHRLPDRRP